MNPFFHSRFGTSLRLLVYGVMMHYLAVASAATLISGKASGTWSRSQSPYVITADTEVPADKTLVIQPGVVVFGAPDVRFTAFGGLIAVGTPAQPIIIRGASPTKKWPGLALFKTNTTYRFAFCQFRDFINAVSSGAGFVRDASNTWQTLEIENCDFVNGSTAVAVSSYSGSGPVLSKLELHNSVFEEIDYVACYLAGTEDPANLDYPVGDLALNISGNLFKRVAVAVTLAGAPRHNDSTDTPQLRFVNNTIANSTSGVEAGRYVDPAFQMVIKNNLFLNMSNALISSTARTEASYNLFYGNQADFKDFPTIYGLPILNNRNGDPCDVFNNVFLDPKVKDTTRYLLYPSSPATDAGDPSIKDVCSEFRHGSDVSDIGCYGGEFACGWLEHGFLPVIVTPPEAFSSCLGQTAKFAAVVEGPQPLAYQWFFNRTNALTGETSPTLELFDLQAAQAGLYSLVITNATGAVTSPPAALRISDACLGMQLYAGLSITGLLGRTYEIQSSATADDLDWTPVASIRLDEPRYLFIDTNTPFASQRYFRARLLP